MVETWKTCLTLSVLPILLKRLPNKTAQLAGPNLIDEGFLSCVSSLSGVIIEA